MAEPAHCSSPSSATARADAATSLALDGHVHLQADMPFARIAANFAAAAPDCVPICMIVECAGIDRFAELTHDMEPWGEEGLHDPSTGLHFIAGRQVVSSEGLEVLLLGTRDQSLEKEPAARVIECGHASGAAVCLPWGFGKWLGARRRLVRHLQTQFADMIMLGDITNRPAFWPEPLFAGANILRGSDNLPLAGSGDSVALFGSRLDSAAPISSARDVISLLRQSHPKVEHYGKRKRTLPIVAEQLRLRLSAGAG